ARRSRRAVRLLRDGGARVRRRSVEVPSCGARVRLDLLPVARGGSRACRALPAPEPLAARQAGARLDDVPPERAERDRVLLARGQPHHGRRHPHDPLGEAMTLRRLAFLQWFGILGGGTVWFASF